MPVYINKIVIADPHDLLTVAELKKQLKRDPDNTTEDTLLSGYIDAAIAAAEKYTGISLLPTNYELKTNEWRQCMAFNVGVVSAIVSVKYTDPAGEVVTVDPSNYAIRSLDNYQKEIYFLDAFTTAAPKVANRWDAIIITVATGFTRATIPKTMHQAVLMMAGSYNEIRTDSVEEKTKASQNLLYHHKLFY